MESDIISNGNYNIRFLLGQGGYGLNVDDPTMSMTVTTNIE
jgi:hypothetical protein